MRKSQLIRWAALWALTAGALTACGGSGGGGGGSSDGSATVTGTVYAAPVSGATLQVRNAAGSVVAGPVTTGADGAYSIVLSGALLASQLQFEATGGTFTDEATGAATTAGELLATVAAGALQGGSAVHLTPATTVVSNLIHHGKTLAEANAAFQGAFGFAAEPSVGPKNAPAASANQASRLAAVRAAGFSHFAQALGVPAAGQFDLAHELAHDLLDGVVDGREEGGALTVGAVTLPEDLLGRYAEGTLAFLADAANRTEVTPGDLGALPFGKVALTSTYRVEYLPGMMAAAVGRTPFRVKVSLRSNGAPVPGLSVSLFPTMYMDDMEHTAPVDGVVDNGDGTYGCTAYYLMMSGPGMGYWGLDVTAGGEVATFYPNVGMAMGTSTVRATLKGQADKIANTMGMGPAAARTYYLFRDGLSGSAGNHTFSVFLGVQESMMSMPALTSGLVLHDPMNAPWQVASVTVEASTDGATWVAGTNTSGAHWSVAGLAGLSSGTPGRVYVRLRVNGEQKTVDGAAPSGTGTNDYASFTVTP